MADSEPIADSTTRTAKRDDIIHVAFQAFFRHGFHTTTVDEALAGTGISKRTLYKYFSSKEELVMATLDHYSTLMVEQLLWSFRNPALSTLECVTTYFDLQANFLRATQYRGCYALRAQMEYTGKHPGIEAACAYHFEHIADSLDSLLNDRQNTHVALSQPANHILLLLHGAMSRAQTGKNDEAFALAKQQLHTLWGKEFFAPS